MRLATRRVERQTPEQLAAAHDYMDRLWYVWLAPPIRGLFAANGYELTAVLATLLICERDGILPGGYRLAPTADPAQRWVDVGLVEWFIAHEGMMRELVGCLRRNGCHGSYRKAGTERTYGF